MLHVIILDTYEVIVEIVKGRVTSSCLVGHRLVRGGHRDVLVSSGSLGGMGG